MNKEIKKIREEIFRLCKQAPDLETLHWYIAVDDCFENDEFNGEVENLKWRVQVLNMKKEPITKLAWAVDPFIKTNPQPQLTN